MRILQLILAPRLSGAEMLVKGIAIGHRESGHAVCIASLLPPHGDFAPAAGELAAHRVACDFPSRRYDRFGRLVFLYRAVRRFKPDVIFAHATIPALYVRALPLRVPIVWVMHSGVNDFENNLLQRAERILSLRARAVIGVSQKNVDEYRRTIGAHPTLVVIPNGVDAARFRSCRLANSRGCNVAAGTANIAGAAGRRGRPKRIVQVGRYIPEKGQLDTVRAFRYVAETEPDTCLLLCGVIENRAYYDEVCELVRTLGLTDRVEIAGAQTHVDEILAGSDVFAMPSGFEAHSIGFLEALASGIPIVANRIAAFRFAQSWPGVRLLDTSDAPRYGAALAAALDEPRAQRPLDGLTLEDTAGRYLDIARQVVG